MLISLVTVMSALDPTYQTVTRGQLLQLFQNTPCCSSNAGYNPNDDPFCCLVTIGGVEYSNMYVKNAHANAGCCDESPDCPVQLCTANCEGLVPAPIPPHCLEPGSPPPPYTTPPPMTTPPAMTPPAMSPPSTATYDCSKFDTDVCIYVTSDPTQNLPYSLKYKTKPDIRIAGGQFELTKSNCITKAAGAESWQTLQFAENMLLWFTLSADALEPAVSTAGNMAFLSGTNLETTAGIDCMEGPGILSDPDANSLSFVWGGQSSQTSSPPPAVNSPPTASPPSGTGGICDDCKNDYTDQGSECCDSAWKEFGLSCGALSATYSWDCAGCNCPGDGECGDGTCNSPPETAVNCPKDCSCGDGICDSSESIASCPKDCSVECPPDEVADCAADGDCCPKSWIGDGYCDDENQEWGCDLMCYDKDGGDCGVNRQNNKGKVKPILKRKRK